MDFVNKCSYCGKKNDYKFGYNDKPFCNILCLNSYSVRIACDSVMNQILPIDEDTTVNLLLPLCDSFQNAAPVC